MTCPPLRVIAVCLSTLVLSSALGAQETPPTPNAPPAVVAGIPVNYDEAKVDTYTLPDALVLDNGKPVRNTKTWIKKRRPEIISIFEAQQYGKAPRRPPAESFDVFDKGTPTFNGKAVRKQVMIYLAPDHTGPA